MKLSGVVILYNPQVDKLINNLSKYFQSLDKLIIWRNSKIDENLFSCFDVDKILLAGNETNKGISFALNWSLIWSKNNGYTHMLMMDQDTEWINFTDYIKIINSFRFDNIIQFGPEINKTNTDKIDIKSVPFVITSGSIVDVNKAISIGGFRKDFFVDGIDIDFGYKSRKNGFTIIKILNAHIKQEFGMTYYFWNFRIPSYSSMRLYETVKTHVIIYYDYKKYALQMFKDIIFIYMLKMPFFIIVRGEKKIEKIKSIFKGLNDGLKYIIRNERDNNNNTKLQ